MTIKVTIQEADGVIIDVQAIGNGKVASKSWRVIDTALPYDKQFEGAISGLPAMVEEVVKELK